MRVLVAGATGVIGRQLVPLLTAVGHEVIGVARSRDRAAGLEEAGAVVVAADLLDRAAVLSAVRDAKPEAVVHIATAIPLAIDAKHLDRDFALTDRLRTEGTRNLIDAAHEAGARRIVTQGLAYGYDPGEGLANEDAPFWQNPPKQFAPVLAALLDLERQTERAGGLVLRFGHLYGPHSSYAPGGPVEAQVRSGQFPIVGGGDSVFSWTHAHDAATAIVSALDKPVTGALNIVDDEPAPLHEWLPYLARILGAPAPKHVPALLARAMVGEFGVAFMTRLRGADNARARLELDWRPRHASWRDGFAAELGGQ
ncbi:NAD-dependent epimerase/dehydratase family protein [Flindersiella endophytica]